MFFAWPSPGHRMGAHPLEYDFTPFLQASRMARETDPLLEAWLERHGVGGEDRVWLDEIREHASGVLRDTADFVERPEHLPRLLGKGPYDNDPQQVVLPAETWEALEWIHASRMWDPTLSDRARYAAVFLLNQNGEMGINCSVACTDGLWRVLNRYPDDERSRAVLASLERPGAGEWVHGAQFVTEIQGGSDAGRNAVVAREEEEAWSLWGQKWFCSNLTADYWLVTARPEGAKEGSKGVGLFCVPRDQDGYTIERLKDKLGTRALPTAEIVFRGAKGWPVGPLEKGLATMVSDVLVTSRIHNVLAAAAFVRSAAIEARAYAQFREAFGHKLEKMPLVADALSCVENTADRMQAGAFATVDMWLDAQKDGADEHTKLWARVLVSLAKAVTTRRAPALVYQSMMVLGGNGIEERFTHLPRLWRDSAILETWEGPYTLLMMNALNDLVRGGVQGDEAAFLDAAIGSDALATDLARILGSPQDESTIQRWPGLAARLYDAWEERALERMGDPLKMRA